MRRANDQGVASRGSQDAENPGVKYGNDLRQPGGDRDFADLDQPATVSGTWQPKSTMLGLTLDLTLTRPTGFVAAEKRVEWLLPRSGGQNIEDMQPNHLPY